VRGSDERSGSLFSYIDLEARVRPDHPLRTIREIANAALADLTGEFAVLYPPRLGRPSIAPERLLRAMLLQAFYGIRSERQLMERMEFDLLFRWFVGLGVDDAAWDHSSFSKNRDRLLEGEFAAKFLAAVLAQPKVKRLLSSDHFSVDGTLLEAWASIKSFRRTLLLPHPRRIPWRSRGRRRSNRHPRTLRRPCADRPHEAVRDRQLGPGRWPSQGDRRRPPASAHTSGKTSSAGYRAWPGSVGPAGGIARPHPPPLRR
jgi:transposase